MRSIGPRPVCLFTVCTPDELEHWPQGRWTVLDCADEERTRRLADRGEDENVIGESLADAAQYRALGLPSVDTTSRSINEVAQELAARLAN